MAKVPAVREDLGIVSALDYGATMNAATINAALTDIGGSDKGLLIEPVDRAGTPGSWTIDANVTIPTNVVTIVPWGTSLDVQSSITWTQNGQMKAGPYLIFQGAGNVVFGTNIDVRAVWTGGNAAQTVYRDLVTDSVEIGDILRLVSIAPNIDLIDNDASNLDDVVAQVRFLRSDETFAGRVGYLDLTGDFYIDNNASGEIILSCSTGLRITEGPLVPFIIDNLSNILMPILPTSSSGLPSGALWNNGGVVNIV